MSVIIWLWLLEKKAQFILDLDPFLVIAGESFSWAWSWGVGAIYTSYLAFFWSLKS